MSRSAFQTSLLKQLDTIHQDGLWKTEREIHSPQGGTITLAQDRQVLNLCANNYLGLANNPAIIKEANQAMHDYGFGMASVRFICGTLDLHRQLEHDIAAFLGTDDSITFAACFDANGAVFDPLFGPNDAIVSDSLNHASIIDGIRLCKARRYRFDTRDYDHLDAQLSQARTEGAEHIIVVTDGVFSMDGYIADLATLCDVADRHGALVMVDDCHATGVVGPGGRGTPALHSVVERIDIVTSTLGKALGGGMGGFIAASQPIIDLLRQRARPYLFSNALAPALVAGGRRGLALAHDGDGLRAQLFRNAQQFRTGLTNAGFELSGDGHPIIPVMLGDATLATEFADRLANRGLFVTAFSYPVVPMGAARIRTQMNAAHTEQQITQAINAFVLVGQELGVIENSGHRNSGQQEVQ